MTVTRTARTPVPIPRSRKRRANADPSSSPSAMANRSPGPMNAAATNAAARAPRPIADESARFLRVRRLAAAPPKAMARNGSIVGLPSVRDAVEIGSLAAIRDSAICTEKCHGAAEAHEEDGGDEMLERARRAR